MILIAPAIGILCAVVGVFVALAALRKNARRVTATRELAEHVFAPHRIEAITRRLQLAEVRFVELVDRAKTAVNEIQRSSEELKVPQATLAIDRKSVV